MAESLTTLIARAGGISLRELVNRAGSSAPHQLADLIKSGALQLTLASDETSGGLFGNLKSYLRGDAAPPLDALTAMIVNSARTPTDQLAEQLKSAATAPLADDIEVTPTAKGWRSSISVR